MIAAIIHPIPRCAKSFVLFLSRCVYLKACAIYPKKIAAPKRIEIMMLIVSIYSSITLTAFPSLLGSVSGFTTSTGTLSPRMS